ncbi:MAG: hypothetical protein M3N56_12885, partial [Actinomycetota bacterium]|nr:hypothetical protein [Actinomycetota bacterium]
MALLPATAQAAPPANDRFVDSAGLTGETAIGQSSTVEATFDSGEFDYYGGGSVWWSWNAPTTATVQIDTCGSEHPTPFGVWTGTSVTSLEWVSGFHDGCGGIPATFEAQAGVTYRISAYGEGGAGSVKLRINAPPVNDDLADALALDPLVEDRWVWGATRRATREEGEPVHAGASPSGSVWYRWTPIRTGLVNIDTCASWGYGGDTVVGVYTGSTANALTEVASNDEGGACLSSGGSSVSFLATAGVEYHLAVAGKASQSLDFNLSISPPPANDAFAQASELESGGASGIGYAWGDTRRATSEPDEPAHAGAPPSNSLWHRWTAQSDGPVRILVCGWDVDLRAAVYDGANLPTLTPVVTGVSATCGSAPVPGPGGPGQTSTTPSPPIPRQAVEVSFDAEAGRTYRIAVDDVDDAGGSFNLSLYTRPANDHLAQARPIDRGSYIDGSTRLATSEPGEPVHAGTGSGHSLWFKWTADTSGAVVPSACTWTEGETAALAVYTGEEVDDLTEVATGSRQPSGCVEARLAAEEGTTYLIAVADEGGSTDFDLRLRLPPGNDSLASAHAISGSEYGDSSLASKEPGEPDHAGSPGGRSVWFRWTAAVTGRVMVSTCDASFDTLLAVYSGDPGAGFSALTERGSADAGCSGGGADRGSLVLDVVAGTEYLIAVDGKDGASGWFDLDLTRLGPANDDFESPTVLSGAEASVSGSTSAATRESYEPNHAGGAGMQSVWHRWKAPSNGPGTVTFETCGSSFDTVLAVYTGSSVTSLSLVASSNDDCGTASRVSFAYQPGETYRIAVDGWGATSGDYRLSVVATVPLSGNDDFAAARHIEGAGAIVAGNTTGATKEPGEPDHAGDPGGGSVWYRWTATEDGPTRLDTCGSEIDTLLGVYTGATVDELDEVAANDDAGPCAAGHGVSALTFEAVAGVTYWIAVDGGGGTSGEIVLRLNRAVNDDFANAIAVAAPYARVVGTTLGATAETGEPFVFPVATSSVWYRWTAPQTKRVAVHACAAPGSSMGVKVFRGSSLPTVTPIYGLPLSGGYSTDCAGAYFGGASSGLGFDAIAGTTYSIAVDAPPAGWAPGVGWGSPGSFTLAINAPLNDLWVGPTRILGANASASGSNVGATAEVGEWPHPGGGGSSVWYRWFATASGPVTVDTCASAIDTLLAVHSRPVPTVPGEPALPPPAAFTENDDSGACSNATRSSVTFDAVEGSQYMLAVDGKGGAMGPIAIAVNLQAPDVTAPETAPLASGPIFTWQSGISLGLVPDELGSTFECSVDEGAFAICSLSYEPYYSDTVHVSVTGLAEGEHTLDVRERDLAGNVDPTPSRAEIRVDKTAPDTVIDSGPASPTRDHTVSFGYFATEPASSFGCSIDGQQRSCSSSGVQSFGGLAEGSHTFEVWAWDRAGNTDLTPAAHEFLVDRTAPVVAIVAAPDSPTRSRDARFEFEVDDPDA